MPDTESWYALRVPAGRELGVRDRLKREGIRAEAPSETVRRRISRRQTNEREQPILPRYVLVQLRGDPRPWREPTGGSIDYVRVAGKPVTISSRVVDVFLSSPDRRTATQVHRALKVGCSVDIEDGPFAGLPAKVRRIKGSDVEVDILMFGRRRPVTVPAACLRAA